MGRGRGLLVYVREEIAASELQNVVEFVYLGERGADPGIQATSEPWQPCRRGKHGEAVQATQQAGGEGVGLQAQGRG